MELDTLKKKLSTFKTEGGRLRNVSDDLLIEILVEWEKWQGPSSKFYSAIGSNYMQFGKLLGKAKKLKRDGYGASEFEELVPQVSPSTLPSGNNSQIELVWDGGRIIRFANVELLIDFLKKVA